MDILIKWSLRLLWVAYVSPFFLLSTIAVVLVVVVPTIKNTFPIPFLTIITPIVMSATISQLIIALLYSKEQKASPEFKKAFKQTAIVTAFIAAVCVLSLFFLFGYFSVAGVWQMILITCYQFTMFGLRTLVVKVVHTSQVPFLENCIR